MVVAPFAAEEDAVVVTGGTRRKKTLGLGVRAQSFQIMGRMGIGCIGPYLHAWVHHFVTSERGLHSTGKANPLGWQHFLNLSVLSEPSLASVGVLEFRCCCFFKQLALL